MILALERLDPGWTQPHHRVSSDYRGSYRAGIYESEMNGNPWRIVQPCSSEPTTATMLGLRSLSGFPFDWA